MKSIDGTIVTFTTTGTYQLAKNCTGSATLTNQDDETENSNIFMNNTNKGAFLIQTDANHVVSSIAYEQGKAPCTTWAFIIRTRLRPPVFCSRLVKSPLQANWC